MNKIIGHIGLISLISLIGFISLIGLISQIGLAQAQIAPVTQVASQFLISWRSYGYAPTWYSGKILATRGSWVDVSFELIEKGKPVDISKRKVRWYVNDDLRRNEDNGLGIKNYSFIVDKLERGDIEVRIVVIDQNDEQQSGIVVIPLANPQVVVDAPYSGSRVPSGTNTFRAYPFFFNVRDLSRLSFNWSVGGRAAESSAIDSSVLKLNIDKLAPSGFGLDIRATINNLFDEMEFASSRLKMEVK